MHRRVPPPVAGRAPGTARLAVRTLARQRARTGRVVAAILAVASLAVFGSALALSTDAPATARFVASPRPIRSWSGSSHFWPGDGFPGRYPVP